jgi:mono/diheme cytochrome c family protein
MSAATTGAIVRRYTLTFLLAACLIPVFTGAVVGCSSSGSSGGSAGNGGGMMGGGGSSSSPGSGMMGTGGSGAKSYTSVGERIYLTGVGSDGQAIAHTTSRVSQGSLMMGGGGCGSCHGANGRGGTIRMMTGSAIKAPDVTYDALIKAGFTDATIRRAIRDGLDESGQPLSEAMPRWQMSGADLDATVGYLRVLSAR